MRFISWLCRQLLADRYRQAGSSQDTAPISWAEQKLTIWPLTNNDRPNDGNHHRSRYKLAEDDETKPDILPTLSVGYE